MAEQAPSLQASVYPNPTRGVVTLTFVTPAAGQIRLRLLDLTGRVFQMLQTDSDLLWSVVALCLVQAGSFAVFWLGGRRWRETDAIRQLFEPYGRIVVMHLTIFIATIPVIVIGQPMLAVLVLALLKSGLELGLKQFQVAGPELPSA